MSLHSHAQDKSVESKVYNWNDLKVIKRPQGEARPILEGTTPDFKFFKVHASTLLPKSRMKKEAYTQENEELIIVKEGELTVTIEGKTKVLKAGGVYLPLDAGYPRERLEFILADAGVSVLVTRSELADRMPAFPMWPRIVRLDADAGEIAPMSSTRRARPGSRRPSSSSTRA